MKAESPLLAEHQLLGASFTDFAGWRMPLKYSSELTEHHAVRTAAGVFDLSHMGEIDVVGSDAATLLDYALVGDMTNLAVGKARYSLLCDQDGGVVDDLVVYRLAADRFLVVANAANAGAVAAALAERAAGFVATVDDRSHRTALIAVQGPCAEGIVGKIVADEDLSKVTELAYYAAVEIRIGSTPALVARTGYTGEDGFELYVPNEAATELWHLILDAGRPDGAIPAGLACRDTLRLEAGMALYGHELSLTTNPYEAGLGRVVKLAKDFVGRDALARRADRAVDRKLVGIKGTGRRAAREGYAVYDTDADGGRQIGTITSGALSPTLGYPVALCYLEAGEADVDSTVFVDIRGSRVPFTVARPPFYRRAKAH